MTISQAIDSLTLCLEKFGDVECQFATTTEGNPAIELHNVDSGTVAAAVSAALLDDDAEHEQTARRFNALFPIKDIFIPSRN